MKLDFGSWLRKLDPAFSRGSVLMPASPSYVNFDFGNEVSEDLEHAVRLGVGLMDDYSASLGRPDLDRDVNFYVSDIDGIADKYYSMMTKGPWQGAPKILKWIDPLRQAAREHVSDVMFAGDPTGVTHRNKVFIKIQKSDSPFYAGSKIYLGAHEFNHAQCNNLRLLGLDDAYAQHLNSKPYWLHEGIADFLAYQALSESGILPYENAREGAVRSVLDKMLGPLKQMESERGFNLEPRHYRHSMLAVELLASRSGQSSLLEFYASLPLDKPRIRWEDQFPETFGMSVNEFYDRFAEHEAKGFPRLETPKFVER